MFFFTKYIATSNQKEQNPKVLPKIIASRRKKKKQAR